MLRLKRRHRGSERGRIVGRRREVDQRLERHTAGEAAASAIHLAARPEHRAMSARPLR
jgi:hypothetical protein